VREKIMIHAVLLCCAMLGDGGKPAEPSASDRAAYETAAAKAGKNAAAHVNLALWCETHGLSSERIKHLSIASTLDPSNVLARGLLGLMAFHGKWAKPDQVENEIQDNPKLHALVREYLDRRVRTAPRNVDAQLRLAAWCLENGLKDEAIAHYHVVTGLDPSRDIAWLRLGYKKHRDRWIKPDDLAVQKLEADRQKRADTQWKPRLEKLRDALESSIVTRRLKAEKELYQITDPRAAPMVWNTFCNGGEAMQLVGVELLAGLDGPSAAFCLMLMALEKPAAEVRQRALRALARRDPRDVVGWLINLLHKPYKYDVRRGNGAGTTATLMLDGERFNLRRLYRFPVVDPRFLPFGVNILGTVIQPLRPFQEFTNVIDSAVARIMANNILGEAQEQSQKRNQEVAQTLEDDIRAIDDANTRINYTNALVLPLLESVTGQQLGAEPVAWQKWWAEELGFAFNDRYDETKPSYTETVGEQTLPVVVPSIIVRTQSCFAAGTPVQTSCGTRRIETLAIGDRVLSQHPATGELTFRPVLATTVRPGAQTFRIVIDGETIVATGIHRFWKAGEGWIMARDLKAGDRLRKVDGVATVQSIEPDATQNVYNLNVAENRAFFVGKTGVLVHDVNFVQPVSDPFDRQTNLAPAAPK
jgi:hypothetical protein